MIRRIQIDIDNDGAFDIRAIGHPGGPHVAFQLTRDEALGTVAEWIFGGPEELPSFLRTILAEALWNRGYSPEQLDDEQRAALRAAGKPETEPARGGP